MMHFVFIAVSALVVILVFFGYKYVKYCRSLRSQLRGLGVDYEKISGLGKSLNCAYLKDLIYEKETELAEQNYITTDN